MSACIFLDRDDTLIHCRDLPPTPSPAEPGDLIDPDLVRLLPGAYDACVAFKRAGFKLVVVSNQGTVARGGAPLRVVEAVNQQMRNLLTPKGGRCLIDGTYFCPYHPVGQVARFTREHPWRKPAPGMILAAAEELDIDLTRSWMMGDSARDVEAGHNAGLPWNRCMRVGPEGQFPGVIDASRVVLAHLGEASAGGGEEATVTLHADAGTPLEAPKIRDTVLATARSLAERFGIAILDLSTTGDTLSVTLSCDEVTAVGFAAELRRNTNTWHQAKFNAPLWKSPPA